jgi:hypothetical protein
MVVWVTRFVPRKCTTVTKVNRVEIGFSMTGRKFRFQSSLFLSLCSIQLIVYRSYVFWTLPQFLINAHSNLVNSYPAVNFPTLDKLLSYSPATAENCARVSYYYYKRTIRRADCDDVVFVDFV